MSKKPSGKTVLGKKNIVEITKKKSWWRRLLDKLKKSKAQN